MGSDTLNHHKIKLCSHCKKLMDKSIERRRKKWLKDLIKILDNNNYPTRGPR